MSKILKTLIFVLPLFSLSTALCEEPLLVSESSKTDPRLMALYQQIRKLQISVDEMQKSNQNLSALYEMLLKVDTNVKEVEERFSNQLSIYSSKLAAYEDLKNLPEKAENLERQVKEFIPYQENYQKIVTLIHHLDQRVKKISDEFSLANAHLRDTAAKTESYGTETTHLTRELDSVNKHVSELQKNLTSLASVTGEIDQLGMKTELLQQQVQEQNQQQQGHLSQLNATLLAQIQTLEARLHKEETKGAHVNFDYNWVIAEMERMKTQINKLEKKKR
jgi:chromosome segregation ATPase